MEKFRKCGGKFTAAADERIRRAQGLSLKVSGLCQSEKAPLAVRLEEIFLACFEASKHFIKLLKDVAFYSSSFHEMFLKLDWRKRFTEGGKLPFLVLSKGVIKSNK